MTFLQIHMKQIMVVLSTLLIKCRSAASPGVILHSAKNPSDMLPSSLVQTGRNQSMEVESESKGNMFHATQ